MKEIRTWKQNEEKAKCLTMQHSCWDTISIMEFQEKKNARNNFNKRMKNEALRTEFNSILYFQYEFSYFKNTRKVKIIKIAKPFVLFYLTNTLYQTMYQFNCIFQKKTITNAYLHFSKNISAINLYQSSIFRFCSTPFDWFSLNIYDLNEQICQLN